MESTRSSESLALRRRKELYKNKRWFRRICALIMGLIMLAVVLIVTYVIYLSLNKPDPPSSICIVVNKDSWNPVTDKAHVLMEVSDFDDENI